MDNLALDRLGDDLHDLRFAVVDDDDLVLAGLDDLVGDPLALGVLEGGLEFLDQLALLEPELVGKVVKVLDLSSLLGLERTRAAGTA